MSGRKTPDFRLSLHDALSLRRRRKKNIRIWELTLAPWFWVNVSSTYLSRLWESVPMKA